MRIECALLCDAATVREELLHVLGGGVSRLHRAEFPAAMAVQLAIMLRVHPTEIDRAHAIKVIAQDADGGRVAELEAQFQVNRPEGLQPGQQIAVPFVLPLEHVGIPHQGYYSLEVLLDDVHAMSLPFDVVLLEPKR